MRMPVPHVMLVELHCAIDAIKSIGLREDKETLEARESIA